MDFLTKLKTLRAKLLVLEFLKKVKQYIAKFLYWDYTAYHEQTLDDDGSVHSNWTYIDWKAIRTMLVAFAVELVIVLLINFLFF